MNDAREESPGNDVSTRPKVARGSSDPTDSTPPPHSTLSLPRLPRNAGGGAAAGAHSKQNAGGNAGQGGSDAVHRIPRSSSVSEARGTLVHSSYLALQLLTVLIQLLFGKS